MYCILNLHERKMEGAIMLSDRKGEVLLWLKKILSDRLGSFRNDVQLLKTTEIPLCRVISFRWIEMHNLHFFVQERTRQPIRYYVGMTPLLTLSSYPYSVSRHCSAV